MTPEQAELAMQFFVSTGKIEPPGPDTRIGYCPYPEMDTTAVSGLFLTFLAVFLLDKLPEFEPHFTISSTGFESEGLDIHVVGHDSTMGYVRIARVVQSYPVAETGMELTLSSNFGVKGSERDEFDAVSQLVKSHRKASDLLEELERIGFHSWELGADNSMAAGKGIHGVLGVKHLYDRVVEVIYELSNGEWAKFGYDN